MQLPTGAVEVSREVLMGTGASTMMAASSGSIAAGFRGEVITSAVARIASWCDRMGPRLLLATWAAKGAWARVNWPTR